MAVANEDSPISLLELRSSNKIHPKETLDIKLYPDKRLYTSNSTFHLGADNNLILVIPHLNTKILQSRTEWGLWVTLNGEMKKWINVADPQDGVMRYWELPLEKGKTNHIECICDMRVPIQSKTEGANDIQKAVFTVYCFLPFDE